MWGVLGRRWGWLAWAVRVTRSATLTCEVLMSAPTLCAISCPNDTRFASTVWLPNRAEKELPSRHVAIAPQLSSKPVMMLGFDSWALRSYALKPRR